MFRGLKYNGSGYLDLTAYQAIINIYKNSGGNKPFNKEKTQKAKRERTVLMKNKKKIIRNTGIILTVAALSMSFTASAAGFETWYVNARSGLNLRAEPTTSSRIITAYPRHTELKVIGTDGGKWWQVYDGTRQGWVYSDYMSESTDKTKTKSKTKAKASENNGDIGDCIGTFHITGYTSSPSENGGYSVDCFGQALEPQIGKIIAVDPNVIPLGSTVYIEGVGYRTARDTGGAIRGNRIDVLTGSNSESYAVTGDKKVYMVNNASQ